VLDRSLARRGLAPRFALLVPVEGKPARYRLYVQGPGLANGAELFRGLEADLQAGLEENPHYRYAVSLGQLARVEVQALRSSEPAWRIYERRCLARGQKAGDVKPTALDRWTGWAEEFRAAGL
jgi:hypothetical protein